VDLPTYTNIWRIEKRLYKLYDFRLPMPLPIGQLTVFAAIAVPYVVLLTLLGLPFNHKLIWLYLLPPGVLTWLATRPVLESKRLPELVVSQLRYLAEPRVWCRMAPLAEKDLIVVTGRVWRRTHTGQRPAAGPAVAPAVAASLRRPWPSPSRPLPNAIGRSRPTAGPAVLAAPWPAGSRAQGIAGSPPAWSTGAPAARLSGPTAARASDPATRASDPSTRPPGPPARTAGPGWLVPAGGWPAGVAAAESGAPSDGGPRGPVPVPAGPVPGASVPPAFRGSTGPPAGDHPVGARPAGRVPAEAEQRAEADTAPPPIPAGAGPQRGVVTVVNAGPGRPVPPAVERALAGPSAHRGDSRPGRVLVVPGGHRPGKPDQLQRDRSRAQLLITAPSRIVVLGCTVGAGQTITTLLTGEMLASLRADQVAVLDLNPGATSLAQRAKARPALNQAASLGPSRLEILGQDQVIGARQGGGPDELAQARGPADGARAFELASARYQLVLADPSTSAVPRLLAIADQLVLVAPASAAAAGAIAMTFEWLDTHGQAGLSDAAILVMNGVSRRTMPQVEQAERVAAGRCRAIVRVPWDDQLGNPEAKRTRATTPGTAPGELGTSPREAGRPGAGLPGAGQGRTGQDWTGQGRVGQHRAGQHWTGLLSQATAGAYTALAGVLVAALADRQASR
jgi:TcpE family